MTKAQHIRIILNLDAARRDERYSPEQVETATREFGDAIRKHLARMAARSATTQAEIEKFFPTPEPWCGYFLLEPTL